MPEDITMFTLALAFMIDHENKIFSIPENLLEEIAEHRLSKNAQVIAGPRPTVKVMT